MRDNTHALCYAFAMSITRAQLLSASSEQLLKLVDRRHPEYQDTLEHWDFLESCYRGGREWISKNIFTYHKEGKKEFKKRKERAYRFPHSKEVISLVNKYVFKGTIERRDELPDHLKAFWGAATLMKRPISDLMDSISTWTSTFGRIWIVVDNNVPDGVRSVADQKQAGGRCYAYHIKPQQAYDFAYDADGELEWFLNGFFARDDQDPLNSTGSTEEQFRLWTKGLTAVIKVTGKGRDRKATVVPEDITEHNLGVVPVFPADHLSTEDLYKAAGLIEDVAYMDRAVANYLSNLDVIIQDQTFSQLAIPYQGLLPSEGSDDDDPESEELNHIQQMGTRRVFAYNAEGGTAPNFISPDVKQAGMIVSTVTKIVGEIYHSIGMAGERTKEDNAAGIDNSSGVAKAYDFEKLNAMLAAKARALQNVEKNLVRLVNAWNSSLKELQETEDYVTYPQTFDVRNLADEMDNAQRLAVMNAPKKLRQAQMKRLAKKMFPQASEEELNAIVDDIEKEWLKEVELDLMGGPNGGPPALGKGRVPGKKNSQGENNKGSVKADDKAEEK
jgi:hypothetical protein